MRVERYELDRDSRREGEHRGGDGIVREVRVLEPASLRSSPTAADTRRRARGRRRRAPGAQRGQRRGAGAQGEPRVGRGRHGRGAHTGWRGVRSGAGTAPSPRVTELSQKVLQTGRISRHSTEGATWLRARTSTSTCCPGFDDGPASHRARASRWPARRWPTARGEVVATPHVRRDFVTDVSDLPERVAAAERGCSRREGIELRCTAGGELGHEMVGALSPARARDDRARTAGARWLLLETPFEGLDDGVSTARRRAPRARLRRRARPSRAQRAAARRTTRAPARTELARGTVPQVNAWSLAGGYGAEAEATAARLVRERLAGVIASDAHPGWRAPRLRVGAAAGAHRRPHRAARPRASSSPARARCSSAGSAVARGGLPPSRRRRAGRQRGLARVAERDAPRACGPPTRTRRSPARATRRRPSSGSRPSGRSRPRTARRWPRARRGRPRSRARWTSTRCSVRCPPVRGSARRAAATASPARTSTSASSSACAIGASIPYRPSMSAVSLGVVDDVVDGAGRARGPGRCGSSGAPAAAAQAVDDVVGDAVALLLALAGSRAPGRRAPGSRPPGRAAASSPADHVRARPPRAARAGCGRAARAPNSLIAARRELAPAGGRASGVRRYAGRAGDSVRGTAARRAPFDGGSGWKR